MRGGKSTDVSFQLESISVGTLCMLDALLSTNTTDLVLQCYSTTIAIRTHPSASTVDPAAIVAVVNSICEALSHKRST